MSGFINHLGYTGVMGKKRETLYFCCCQQALLSCLHGWSCGRCGHRLLFHKSALVLVKQLWQCTALWSTADEKTPCLDKDGRSLGYTLLAQTLQARDIKLSAFWHTPHMAIAQTGTSCVTTAFSSPARTPPAMVRSYRYLHTLPPCAPSGSSPGAQDISVNVFSLPVSGPFICQPPKLKAQPFCQSHQHSSH